MALLRSDHRCSDRDKDVSFYRIPSVRTGRSSEELELSKNRREGFLVAISRADLTESKLENGRICSRHFISGKLADLFDSLNPDWLPTLHLGHSKKSENVLYTKTDIRGRRAEWPG